MSRRLALAAALLCAGLSTSAFAHAHLRAAQPPVGSTVPGPPSEVTCSFSEALEPRFSSIQVLDAAGKRVDQGELHLAKDDAKQATIGVMPLPPGVYTVHWAVTSVDTHKTQGSFRFTVAP